jgi:DNA-binding MarR family transcriptional regulator
MALKDDIRLGKPFPNDGVQAFLTLGRTLFELLAEPEALLKQHGISATQHNVLRILRGSPKGLPLSRIAERMVARDPDLTRLIDRMQRQGLVQRVRSDADRRVILGRITAKGLRLCDKLDAPVTEIHKRQFRKLGKTKTRQLIALLEELREHNRSQDD